MRKASAIAVAISLLLIAAAIRTAPGSIGTIIGVSGTGAKIIVAGSDYEIDAAPKKELNDGDTIITPAGAMISILMSDGSQLKVNENSRMTLHDTADPGLDDVEIDEGELWAEMAELGGGLEMNTPSGVVAVRGTEFNIKADSGGVKTTVTVVQGAASFSNSLGSVDLGAGMQSSATPSTAPTPPVAVDTRFFVEWTAVIESIGSAIEVPLETHNRYVLEDMKTKLLAKTAVEPSADDLAQLAAVYHDLGQYAEAEKQLNMAIKVNQNHESAGFGLGMVMVKTGRSEEAAEHFKSGKGGSRVQLGLGLALLKLNKVQEAESALKTAADAEAGCLPLVGLSVVAMKKAEIDEAAALLRKAIDVDGSCYQAYTRMAEIELTKSNMETAQEFAEKAVALQAFSPEAHATLAKVLFFMDEKSAAKVEALKAVELDAFHSGAQDILAMIAVAEGQIRQAQKAALRAIALDQHNAHAHDVLAQVYMIKRNRDAALVHWERAIKAEPKYVPAHLHMAQLLNTIHKPEKAEEHLRIAIEVEPRNDRVVTELGRAMELQHKFDEAEKYYVQAVELDPNYAKNRARLASFYMDRFRLKDAMVQANAAVEAEPNNPLGYLALGLIHDELDNTESASLNYRKALSLNTEDAQARYRLGIIMGEDRNRFFEALSEMRRAELVEPTVIVREELRGDRRYSLTVGDEGYLTNTLAGSGYAFNRNMIYKLRLSDTRDNYNTPPKIFEYDPNLRSIDSGGDMDPESFDQSSTLLINYRPDYYRSFIFTLDTDHSETGYPTKSAGTAYDTTNYDTQAYVHSELSYRRILGPKSALTFHFAKTNIYSMEHSYTFRSAETEDTMTEFFKYETMYETKYCRVCKMKIGAALWDSNIRVNEYRYKTLDYQTWSTSLSSNQSENYEERIFYTDHEFKIRHRVDVTLRGQRTDHDLGGARDTGEISLAYRLPHPDIGFYIREGQNWHVTAAESLRPSDTWAYVNRYQANLDGQRSYFREASIDGNVTPSTYMRLSFYEQKRKTYTSGSDYSTVASRVDEDGMNITVEQELWDRGNLNFSLTERSLNDVLNNAPVPNEPLYFTKTNLHYFFTDKWHTSLSHEQYSSEYLDSTITKPTGGYDRTDILLYFEPNMDKRFYLHVGNILGNDVPVASTDSYDDDVTFRLGSDIWF